MTDLLPRRRRSLDAQVGALVVGPDEQREVGAVDRLELAAVLVHQIVRRLVQLRKEDGLAGCTQLSKVHIQLIAMLTSGTLAYQTRQTLRQQSTMDN